MVGHQEPDQSEEQETLNQMLTRAAARRKAIARQNDPRYPDQHLAHFRATYGNTGGNSALLLRQFLQSLLGVAFESYYSLEDETITTWDDMEEAFRTKFATVSDKITIADPVATRRRKDESMLEYITWWRNLSIRCEQSIEQTQAVGLLMGNVDNWMAPFICTTKCTIFQDLILNVSRLERTDPHTLMNLQKPKREEGKKVEVKVEHSKAACTARTNIVEKGKKIMTTTTSGHLRSLYWVEIILKDPLLRKGRIKFIPSKGTN
uniref:Retrotransposon gag domain-containing protein n=1 Tax=Ananas comosus var. bracteatus TaxID=296719 RepID=A0A6V7P259_ANACO|nr:unnamed protein product [Ananas comosus var. bracteatus]